MQNCMRKYINEFAIKFAVLMQKQLYNWKQIQSEERKNLYNLKSFGFYLLVILIGFIPGRNEHDYSFTFHCWLSFFCLIGGIFMNIKWKNKAYQNKIKSKLFPELLKVFNENIHYSRGGGITSNSFFNQMINYNSISDFINKSGEIYTDKIIPNNVFEDSNLYTEEITQREDDDIFWGEYKDVEFFMNEVDFGWVSNSRRRIYHSMFHGLAMKFSMNKNLSFRVLILTKHSFTKIPPNYERVTLEYEKFNKKYDVWVEKDEAQSGYGQIEARYLLNTAFMERLLQIQTSFKVNKMCCSILNNRMLIMLSTNRDLFEMNHLLGKVDDVSQYNVLFDEFASVLSFIEVLNLSSKTHL